MLGASLERSLEMVDAADARKVGRCWNLVADILKGRPFACEEDTEDASMLPPPVGGAGVTARTAGGAGDRKAARSRGAIGHVGKIAVGGRRRRWRVAAVRGRRRRRAGR